MFREKRILQMSLGDGSGTEGAPWATALCRRGLVCTVRKAWCGVFHGTGDMMQKPLTGRVYSAEEGCVETALTG